MDNSQISATEQVNQDCSADRQFKIAGRIAVLLALAVYGLYFAQNYERVLKSPTRLGTELKLYGVEAAAKDSFNFVVFAILLLGACFLLRGICKIKLRWSLACATILSAGLLALASNQQANARQSAAQSLCRNNLRLLSGTKDMMLLERRKRIGEKVSADDFRIYRVEPGKLKCPDGGNYSLNPAGDEPTCSIAGHSLSKK